MTELQFLPAPCHSPPIQERKEQQRRSKSGEEAGSESWDSDIAHALLVLTDNMTHGPSEQFGGVNKVSFMEQNAVVWANIAQLVVTHQLCQ